MMVSKPEMDVRRICSLPMVSDHMFSLAYIMMQLGYRAPHVYLHLEHRYSVVGAEPRAVCHCVGSFLETFLYGVYVVFFAFSLLVQYRYATRQGNRSYRASTILSALAIILFVVFTAHWIISFVSVYNGFIVNRATPLGPLLYFALRVNSLYITQFAIYIFAHVLVDSLLVIRLAVFWNSNIWVLILPCCSLAGEILAAPAIFVYMSWFDGPQFQDSKTLANWTTAGYAMTAFTNIFSSALIVYRAIMKDRDMREFNLRSSLMPFMVIVIESASVYTLFHLVLFVLYKNQSLGLIIAFAIGNPFTGIVFSLITIQIGKGFTYFGASELDDSLTDSVKHHPAGRRANGHITPLGLVTTPGRCTPSAMVPLEALRGSSSERNASGKLKKEINDTAATACHHGTNHNAFTAQHAFNDAEH